MREWYSNYLKENHSFDRVTLLAIFALIIVIAGCFGFFYEYIFYFFNGGCREFYWRGGNFLPWINIYATGAMIIYGLTYKKRTNPLKVFFISFFACGILEYFSGLGMYIIGNGMRCWDYNKEILNFGNIDGFVCLRSVLVFGISSLILMYIVVPGCFYLAKRLDKKLFVTISFTLCSIILIDEFYNLLFARILKLPRARNIYTKLGMKYVKFNWGNKITKRKNT